MRSQVEKSVVVCCMAVCLTGIAGNLGTVLGWSFQGEIEQVQHEGGKPEGMLKTYVFKRSEEAEHFG